jgi:hypothetical protein
VHRLIPHIPAVLACAVVALVLTGLGGARSAESVTCSSTTAVPRDSLGKNVDLTGRWISNTGRPFYLRQVGNCLWWTGDKARTNVFVGTVLVPTVTGIWTDVLSRSKRTNGTLTLLLTSQNNALLVRRTSTSGLFPAKYLKRSSTR